MKPLTWKSVGENHVLVVVRWQVDQITAWVLVEPVALDADHRSTCHWQFAEAAVGVSVVPANAIDSFEGLWELDILLEKKRKIHATKSIFELKVHQSVIMLMNGSVILISVVGGVLTYLRWLG